jgi:TRAP-type mannitol/chloroaromatic compound transport system substrate-binding protein
MHRAEKRDCSKAKLLLALFAAWLLGASWAQAVEFSWKMQAFQPADSMPALEFRSFAQRLKAASGDRIEIEVLAAGTLVPNDETPRAINAGLLQGQYSTPSFFANLDPAFAVLGDSLAAYEDPMQRDGWFYEGGGLELSRKLYATNGLYFIGPVYWPADWMPSMCL